MPDVEFPSWDDVRDATRKKVPDGYQADALLETVRQYGQGRYWQGYGDRNAESAAADATAELTWEEPPEERGRLAYTDETVEALRANPGKWARLGPIGSASVASNIKRGRPVAYQPAGSFDAVSRKINGELILFARYLGES